MSYKNKFLRVGLALVLITTLLLSLSAFNLPGVQAAPGNNKVKVFIGFTHAPGAAEEALVRAFGGEIEYTYEIVPAIAAELPEQALPGLLRNPKVTLIESVIEVYLITDPVYQQELDNTWGVKRIGAGSVHIDGRLGSGVKVAIIDSGIDYNHPELAGNYIGGYDFADNDNDPMDKSGHGTHVAGTVAAVRDGSGVVGAAPAAELYALKVFGDDGSGDYTAVIAALDWAVLNGIQVTNNSYGSRGDPGSIVKDAFDNAANAGILHIAAAGNNGFPSGRGDNVGYPARFDSVLAVAASDSGNKRASFSSTGPAVEIIAPGVAIRSTIPGGDYASYNGTSMASPHVAGVAALVWAAAPNLGPADVRAILTDTAQDLGLLATHQGNGLVRADLAMAAVSGPSNVPVTGVSIDPINQTIEVEETVQLSATVSPENATTKDVSWTSSDDLVATVVTGTGLVKGVSAGTAIITVTTSDGDFTDTVVITVNATSVPVGVESVSINEDPPTIEVGATVQLSATVSPENATNKDVSWASDNEAIAKVTDTGLVTGVSEGTAKITVTAVDGGGATDSVLVIVQAVGELTALNVAITNPKPNLPYTWNSWIDIVVEVTDQHDSAVGGADVKVIIESQSGNIATYIGTSNAEGIFTARYRVPNRADPGDYIITASAIKDNFGSNIDTVTFTVTGR